MTRRASFRLLLLVAVASTIGCDRVTKHFARGLLADAPARSYLADTVRLEYAENTGGFLGMGAESPVALRTALFTIGTSLTLVMLGGVAIRRRWRGWSLVAVSLVIAGGGSNLIDRIIEGRVVDFLNVGVGPIRTGIFNAADMAIMVGIALLLFVKADGSSSSASGQPKHQR